MERNKKKIGNNLFSLLLSVFSLIFLLVYLVNVDGISAAASVLKQTRVAWLLLAVGCMALYWFLEAYALHLTVRGVHLPQKFRDTMRISMIGQYFNNITPFASGGQPMQSYFMIRRGAQLSESMSALLTKFIVYQITLTAYCLVTLILRFSFFVNAVQHLMVLVLIGFAVSASVTAFLIGAAFFKKGLTGTVNFIIGGLAKIRIVKNPDARRKAAGIEIEKFSALFRQMSKNKPMLLKLSLITVVQLTANFLIGNIIYLSFGLSGADTLTLLACQAFVAMISSFAPTPGAIGAAEGSFALFFSLFFPNKLVSLAVVLWRLITFYLPIIIGLLFTILEKRRPPVIPVDAIPSIDEIKNEFDGNAV